MMPLNAAAYFLEEAKSIEALLDSNGGLPQEQSLRVALSELRALVPDLVDGTATPAQLREFGVKYAFVLGNLPPLEDSSFNHTNDTEPLKASASILSMGAAHDMRGQVIAMGVSPRDVVLHPINGQQEAMISVDGIVHILRLQETPQTRVMWRDYRKALRKLHKGRDEPDNNTKHEAIKVAFAASGHHIQPI